MLAEQVGIERYHLSEGGKLMLDYDAVSVIPLEPITRTQGAAVEEQRASTPTESTALGLLITTEPLAHPELAPGIYTVESRPADLSVQPPGSGVADAAKRTLIFRECPGAVVAAITARDAVGFSDAATRPHVAVGTDAGQQRVTFTWAVRVSARAAGKRITVRVPVTLAASAAAGPSWRLPRPQ
ncbi:MAG: hypothetical protein AAF628_03205 [Planctomycetota bacterium]